MNSRGYSFILVIILASLIPLNSYAQKEEAFATTYGADSYEIVFFITQEGKYEIAKLETPATKVNVINLGKEYFKTVVDRLFDDLDASDDAMRLKLSEVSNDLLKQIEQSLRNEIFRSRLEDVQPGKKIGTLHIIADTVTAVSGKTDEILKAFFSDKNKKSKKKKKSKQEKSDTTIYSNMFIVKEVEMSFQNGTVTDMQISGTFVREDGTTEEVQYRNKLLIALGTPTDIERFNGGRYLLWARQKACPASDPSKCDRFTGAIDPSTIIRYQRHVIGAGTYVPRDTVLTIPVGEATEAVTLEKRSFISNLDGRIYSDVTGLKADNPNGVLQIEVKYEHIANTRNIDKTIPGLRNSIFLNKVIPFIVFPKLQDNLRSLQVGTVLISPVTEDIIIMRDQMMIDSTIIVQKGSLNTLSATPIDVLRFADLHLGVGVDVVNYFSLKTKLSFGFDTGLYRAKIDSSSIAARIDTAKFDVNIDLNEIDKPFYYFAPRLSLFFVESQKFDFELLWSFIWMRSIADEIRLEGGDIHKFQVNVNLHPNPNSRDKSVFFRATFFKATDNFGKNPNNNLTLQIGYATPISKLFGN